jgi:excisionase family DNA binding protein
VSRSQRGAGAFFAFPAQLSLAQRRALLYVVHVPADLITTAEAAKLLGCSVWTVTRAAAEGRLTPRMRVGRSYVFARADVLALADSTPDGSAA